MSRMSLHGLATARDEAESIALELIAQLAICERWHARLARGEQGGTEVDASRIHRAAEAVADAREALTAHLEWIPTLGLGGKMIRDLRDRARYEVRRAVLWARQDGEPEPSGEPEMIRRGIGNDDAA